MLTLCATEFKEIRKEWKQRKKEEENNRKMEDERSRGAQTSSDGQNNETTSSGYGQQQQSGAPRQLPPIAYQPGPQVQQNQYPSAQSGVQQLQEYSGHNNIQYSGYPASPYGAPNNQNSL